MKEQKTQRKSSDLEAGTETPRTRVRTVSPGGAFALVAFGWVAILAVLAGKGASNRMAETPIYHGNEPLIFQKGKAPGFASGFWVSSPIRSLNDNCFYPGSWLVKDFGLVLSVVSQDTFCDGAKHTFKGDLVSTRDRFTPPFSATARMRVASGSGIISAFFSYTDPLDGNPHFENDFEFVGDEDERSSVWLNLYNPDGDPSIGNHLYIPLGLDAAKEFADYSLVVGKTQVTWKVNGKVVRTEQMTHVSPPQRIVFNSWFAHAWTTIFESTSFIKVTAPFEIESVKIIPGDSS